MTLQEFYNNFSTLDAQSRRDFISNFSESLKSFNLDENDYSNIILHFELLDLMLNKERYDVLCQVLGQIVYDELRGEI